jgi:hypothetical protein
MTTHRRNSLPRTLAIAVAALAVAVFALAAFAQYEWRASFGGGTYEQRLASAERAAAIEPWNRTFAARPDWVRGDEYMRRNQPYSGYYHLHRAADIDNSDPRLRAALREAYQAWYVATTWKAHVQHAREQTGGILPEKDHIK